jgi:hypothetical protein
MYQLVLKFARKLKLKPGKEGIMQISNNQEVIDTANDILTTFKKHGVPNEIIKTENDVKTIYNQILHIEDQQLRKNVISPGDPRYKEVTEKIFGKKAGEVVDMSGKTIQKPETIMGGMEGIKARNTKIQGLADQLAKMQKEKSAMYGKKPTDAELKSKLEGMNKKTIDRIRRRRYEAALKAEREKMAKDPYYIPKILDPEDFAEGGRTGYFTGALADTEEGKSMSPGTRHDYSPGQGHRATVEAKGGPPGITTAPVHKPPIKTQTDWGPAKGLGRTVMGNTAITQTAKQLGIGHLINPAFMAYGLFNMFKNPKIDDEDLKYGFKEGGRTGTGLNYLLGEDDQNSRVPFSIGGFNKARRAFLKLMGGAAATGAAAKSGLFGLLKAGKPAAVETLTSVPIGNAAGMPAWFQPLVNKVIKEGNQIESAAERVIVHKTKLPNSKTDVYVTQELDTGHVVVDIGRGKHGFADGHLGQPVSLEYRASEVIEPTINTKTGKVIHKGQKTKPEFNVEEAEFTGGHPENVKFEESTINKYGEHGSDFSEVEEFATGAVKKIKKASGGRVPLAEGTTPSDTQLEQYYRNLEEEKKRRRLQKQLYEQRFGGPGPILEAASGGLAGLLGE